MPLTPHARLLHTTQAGFVTTDTAAAENLETPDSSAAEKREGSWVVSVLFWGTMLAAGALYAAVALSPKLVFYLKLRDEHYQTQVKLVTLEHRVLYLKKVMHALENDPEFAAEHARVELDAERPGDERIAVDQSLHFTPDAEFDPSVFKKSILPWYADLLEVFAADQPKRRGLLIAAALMSLFAFTFFQESQTSQILACVRAVKTGWLRATARYRASAPPADQASAAEAPAPQGPSNSVVPKTAEPAHEVSGTAISEFLNADHFEGVNCLTACFFCFFAWRHPGSFAWRLRLISRCKS